jgi:hypothetical protein
MSSQGKLFATAPQRARQAAARPSFLLRSQAYQRDNLAIARIVLASPDKHITGLVEWARLVIEKDPAVLRRVAC